RREAFARLHAERCGDVLAQKGFDPGIADSSRADYRKTPGFTLRTTEAETLCVHAFMILVVAVETASLALEYASSLPDGQPRPRSLLDEALKNKLRLGEAVSGEQQ